MNWIVWAGLNGFLAVALGAFAAHGLEGRAAPHEIEVFETGARYHMYHALALIGVAWLTTGAKLASPFWPNIAGYAFLVGILLFSGTLYFYGLTGSRALVLLTPVGGVAFLIGWASLAYSGWKALPH